jgi:hypothetical protein
VDQRYQESGDEEMITLSKNGYQMLGALFIAATIVGTIISVSWVVVKSGECHQQLTALTSSTWNMTLSTDMREICNNADNVAVTVLLVSIFNGIFGVFLSYKGWG